MKSIRGQLILVFLAATVAPLGMTVWVTTTLLDRSLEIAASREREIDALSRTLESTGRAFYQRACALLKEQAQSGQAARLAAAPGALADGESEAFQLSGDEGNRLDYYVRDKDGVAKYSASLGDVRMNALLDQYRTARASAEAGRAADRPRGFKYTYGLIALGIWLVSFALLVYLASRISEPIRRLTGGLTRLSAGDASARVEAGADDEAGRAIVAFNHMADEIDRQRDRLVYLAQLASWQTLARKMAHEVKNSLTPIRLTVEEMVARHGEGDPVFLEQASQIIVDEIESLERRIRAFSEFAAEPPVRPGAIEVNTLVEERVQFLKPGHPETSYEVRTGGAPVAWADEDLVKGVLTNLLENAAEAAGAGGRILAATAQSNGHVRIEVHDSGPGLPDAVRRSLFQPTITFKKRGMGLGLSIARKSALAMGGDIQLIQGELGGAGFRVTLPAHETNPHR